MEFLDDINVDIRYELEDECFEVCLELFPCEVVESSKEEIIEYFKKHSIYKILKKGDYIHLASNEEKKVFIICDGGIIVKDICNDLIYMFGHDNTHFRYDSNILFSTLSSELNFENIILEVFDEVSFIEMSLSDLQIVINKYYKKETAFYLFYYDLLLKLSSKL